MEEHIDRQNVPVLTRSEFTDPARVMLEKSLRYSQILHLIRIHIERKYHAVIPEQDEKQVLSITASTLQTIMRKNDLISRWDDNNFVILLPTVSSDATLAVAQKLRVGIENALEGHALMYQIQIETATVQPSPESVDGLLRQIDAIIGKQGAHRNTPETGVGG